PNWLARWSSSGLSSRSHPRSDGIAQRSSKPAAASRAVARAVARMDPHVRGSTRSPRKERQMNFVAGLTIAAALLAIWVDTRFESRRPDSLKRRTIHVVAAFLVLQGADFVSHFLIAEHSGDAQRLLVVFLLFLPALVYTFLS